MIATSEKSAWIRPHLSTEAACKLKFIVIYFFTVYSFKCNFQWPGFGIIITWDILVAWSILSLFGELHVGHIVCDKCNGDDYDGAGDAAAENDYNDDDDE